MHRFEWSVSLADVHRQYLFISVKNNSPLFAHEQTYMGDVRVVEKSIRRSIFLIFIDSNRFIEFGS